MEYKIKECCERCCIKDCENRSKYFVTECNRIKEADPKCKKCKNEKNCKHNQGFINAIECLFFEVKQ